MWRTTTFLEIQDLVTQGMPEIQGFDLFNGQLESYRGDNNEHDYLDPPFVLLELVGGDWEHDGELRIAEEYFIRLYYVCEEYRESNKQSTQQADAIAHLDKVSELANLLDLENLSFMTKIEFVREEIDTSYTNIVSHVLDFVGRVTDDSLQQLKAPAKVNVTQHQTQGFFVPKR